MPTPARVPVCFPSVPERWVAKTHSAEKNGNAMNLYPGTCPVGRWAPFSGVEAKEMGGSLSEQSLCLSVTTVNARENLSRAGDEDGVVYGNVST